MPSSTLNGALVPIKARAPIHVLDEAPKAYKRIDQVMAQQSDLVEIIAELKQVVCVKG
jgi:tRNA-splicing ligase RtcB